MNFLKGVKRKVIASLLVIGSGIGLLTALPATEVLHSLSSNEFCASCHTMEPMVETFANSVHGGNNSHGFVAECVDCHLPKSNIVEELYVKGTSGMRHLWGEYVLGMEELDYEALHPKRTEYVYDSGCVNCHRDLERRASIATEDGKISDWTHNLAFANKDNDPQWKCSSCHYDIAHPNLKENMRVRAADKLRLLAQEGL
ncbi:cytochrome c3 family protein [Vibrio splendidus]|uniref:cytochrome c3 family protein n=1 Tax=Vibrio splendidus TaxID=29497 RepID=UPI002469B274|nr:NapC/NirT family cytochrome c [Vibrio splendidus]MDH5934338.1 NapC/NirT family cytochrome c [Vibrio splendidus]